MRKAIRNESKEAGDNGLFRVEVEVMLRRSQSMLDSYRAAPNNGNMINVDEVYDKGAGMMELICKEGIEPTE